jgi:hypothetical protein
MIKVAGVWRQPAVTYVKVAGSWRIAATVKVKDEGGWTDTPFAGPPRAPQLLYTADREFTITDYNAALTYVLSPGGGTRTGNKVVGAVNNATLKAAYGPTLDQSAPSTMLVAAHGYVLGGVVATPSSAGCSPRGQLCCPGGSVMNTAGATCDPGPGTQGPFCGGSCSDQDCFGQFLTCYSYTMTDYTSSGYVKYGNNWGKAVNG